MQNHDHENEISATPEVTAEVTADGERTAEGRSALAVMQARINGHSGKRLWKSFEELAETPEFHKWVADEFPNRSSLLGMDRKTFLRVSGAAMAMAGLSGCRILPSSKAVPYVRAPEALVQGKPLEYASTLSRFGYGVGVLVISREGRPTKIEGNPRHPASLGSTLAQEQAETLVMYDPDRSQSIVNRKTPGEANALTEFVSYDQALDALRTALIGRAVNGGAGFAVLTDTVTSPSLKAQFAALKAKYPAMKWYSYEPLGRENVHAGTQLAFGRALNPVYRLQNAKVIVSLDANFLTDMPGSIRYSRDFADGRRIRKGVKTMNRLYTVESSYTIVGAMSDHRWAVKPSEVESVARALYAAVSGSASNGTGGPDYVKAIADDLRANPGAAVVVAGEQTSPATQALANAINAAIGAVGSTVVYTEPMEANPVGQTAGLKELTDGLNSGTVQLLAIIGGNPAYDAPADLKFADAIRKAPFSIRLGLYEDETSAMCLYHLPMAHQLETWGDLAAFDGTISITQPLIAPLYNGKSAQEFVAEIAGDVKGGYDLLREYWANRAKPANFAGWWERTLRDGFVPNTAAAPVAVTARPNLEATLPAPIPGGQLEIAFRPDPSIWDGRYANNSWLQELPKPITTIVWDNAAIISPATAKKLGVIPAESDNDAVNFAQYSGKRVVKVAVNGAELDMPVWILPGQPNDTVTVALGFGRTRCGEVGNEQGFDTYKLRTSGTMNYAPNVALTVTPNTYVISSTQPHHLLHAPEKGFHAEGAGITYGKKEENRSSIIAAATFEEYSKKNGDIVEREHAPQLPEATGYGATLAHAEGAGEHGGGHEAGGENAQFGMNEHGSKADGALGGTPNMKGHNQGTGEEIVADAYRKQWAYTDKSASNREGWPSLYPEFSNKGFNAWGMSIDLTTCTGCNACVTACQSENNIPTVGKDMVGKGREMHWIRIDHYYAGEDWDKPESYFQPVACVHCEKAPCEPVCPVAATIHNHEGLNQMVYNRCIGTRYCSNNCPYKVRRFNYLKWTAGVGGPQTLNFYDKPQLKMMANPDVTIRGRGVMEKCTYCVQRINAARIEAKKAGRDIPEGGVITACQQACPTQAIIFGDINNPDSKVSRLREQPHDYSLLAELNTRPRTTYLARITNPNPAIKG